MTIVVNVGNDKVYCRFRHFGGRIRLVSYRPYYGRFWSYRLRLVTVVNDLKVEYPIVYTQFQHDKIGPGVINLALLIFESSSSPQRTLLDFVYSCDRTT